MKVGVFDSGIGGLSVANAIARAMPELSILFRHDSTEHFPYATKSPDTIYGFVVPILEQMVRDECDVIVVACNTVTTTLIDRLRQRFSVPLIGVEPMVRPAAEKTKTGLITVCAPPDNSRLHKVRGRAMGRIDDGCTRGRQVVPQMTSRRPP